MVEIINGKYYYENILANQNIVAKPNVVWVADYTWIDLPESEKLYLFLCIDIHTNKILAYASSIKVITTATTIKVLAKAINERFVIPPKNKLIIHTDRGTQFTSKNYYLFTQQYEEYFEASMSRDGMPKDNSVAERFNRTFKEHILNEQTIQDAIFEALEKDSNKKIFTPIVRRYVVSLNQKPNRKTKESSPERHDNNSRAASELMSEPMFKQGYSERFGDDIRIPEIDRYKLETSQVISILEDIAARKAELVEKTPFDSYEDNLAIRIIDEKINDIYQLLKKNPELTKAYVEDALEPIEDSLNELHRKVDTLLPHAKKPRVVQPLRDPLDKKLFPLFLNQAGNSFSYQKDLKQAQMRIAYTILFFVGLRANEIRQLSKQDIINAQNAAQLHIIHHKTKKAHIHVLSPTAVEAFKDLENSINVVFDKYKYNYLFGKHEPVGKKMVLANINRDLKHTCKLLNLPYNIKSHSFRINVISGLLKHTSVQNAADIIGHQDIRSTMAYQRYALSRKEIEDLLQKINEDEE